MSQSSLTKSIDVGSMFLMDLSVNESADQALEPLTESNQQQAASSLGLDSMRNHVGQQHHHSSKYRKTMTSSMSSANYCHQPVAGGECRPTAYPTTTTTTTSSIADHQISTRATIAPQPDYLGSSLDRIASVINNCDGQQSELVLNDDEHSVTLVEPQPIEEYNDDEDDELESRQSSYSLSDESYVVSSGTSLSSVGYANAAVNSERNNVNNNEDKDSTTTREDSGVLDMKDLEGQLNNSYDDENNEADDSVNYNRQHRLNHNNQRLEQEKPISNNIMATNLINSNSKQSALGAHADQHHHHHQQQTNRHPHRFAKPTNGVGGNDAHHGSSGSTTSSSSSGTSSSAGHASHSRRSVSASLPIQVPVRQMRKDLNKLKLKLMKEEMRREQNSRLDIESDQQTNETTVIADGQQQQPLAGRPIQGRSSLAWDDEDDDAFLEQEYNENHHNHYPINEHDDEHLRAGEDPMRLFASIQALARSLHEDAELFGSLPPKRLVESPVRSIALV